MSLPGSLALHSLTQFFQGHMCPHLPLLHVSPSRDKAVSWLPGGALPVSGTPGCFWGASSPAPQTIQKHQHGQCEALLPETLQGRAKREVSLPGLLDDRSQCCCGELQSFLRAVAQSLICSLHYSGGPVLCEGVNGTDSLPSLSTEDGRWGHRQCPSLKELRGGERGTE